jgi:hypothetical protein
MEITDKKIKKTAGDALEVLRNALNRHLGKNHILIMTSDKRWASEEENAKSREVLQSYLGQANFGYNRVEVTYEAANPALAEGKARDELAYVVYDDLDGGDMLKVFGKSLGKKFRQDAVLFVDKDQKASLIFTREDNSAGKPLFSELELGTFSVEELGKYFEKIGRKQMSFKKVDEEVPSERRVFNGWLAESLIATMKKYGDKWEEKWESRWSYPEK